MNNLANDETGISADMALRLAKAFGSSPETWRRLQMAHGLAEARKREPALTAAIRRLEREDA